MGNACLPTGWFARDMRKQWTLHASGDITAKVWTTVSGKCVCTFEVHGDSVTWAVFSSDVSRY